MQVSYEHLGRLMADWPTLTVDGWQYRVRFAGDGFDLPRGLMLTEEFRAQVQVAADYIAAHGIYADQSSEQIKRAREAMTPPGQKLYLPVGSVIAAALLLGFEPVRDLHAANCTFNKKER